MKNQVDTVKVALVVMFSCLVLLNYGCAGTTSTGPAAPGKAAVAIEPPSGKKSTVITITGTGFVPEEEIDIVITLGPGQLVGLGTQKVEVIVADANGGFSVPSAIPMNAKPGNYPIAVEGNKGSVVKTSITVVDK